MGCQDFHHFWLYTLVPHQADLSFLGSQARKLQGHIKHEWEGYLGNVGQSHPFVTKPYRLGSPKRTNLLGVGLRCKAKNGEDLDTPQLYCFFLGKHWFLHSFCRLSFFSPYLSLLYFPHYILIPRMLSNSLLL